MTKDVQQLDEAALDSVQGAGLAPQPAQKTIYAFPDTCMTPPENGPRGPLVQQVGYEAESDLEGNDW